MYSNRYRVELSSIGCSVRDSKTIAANSFDSPSSGGSVILNAVSGSVILEKKFDFPKRPAIIGERYAVGTDASSLLITDLKSPDLELIKHEFTFKGEVGIRNIEGSMTADVDQI